jgi:hypothetical protein
MTHSAKPHGSASRPALPRADRVKRRLGAAVVGLAFALALAGSADARSFTLVQTDVRVDVGASEAVMVEENITVAFSGAYTFGFRDIPLRPGETITRISVLENGRPYRPGAPTALEPGGPAGTFGTEQRGNEVRIVWRFHAVDESRRFSLRYGLVGLAVAYDDVVDVNLKVWGDEWQQPLGRARLGTPRLGSRRRHARGRAGAAPCPRRAYATVR